MLNRSKIAAVAALALSVASVALTAEANAQRYAPTYGYQSGEQGWLDRASQSREGGN